MARPVRVEYADAIYHVTARGNDRRRIVRDEKDRGKWLEWVERAVVECGRRVFSFALMDSHYHPRNGNGAAICRVPETWGTTPTTWGIPRMDECHTETRVTFCSPPSSNVPLEPEIKAPPLSPAARRVRWRPKCLNRLVSHPVLVDGEPRSSPAIPINSERLRPTVT